MPPYEAVSVTVWFEVNAPALAVKLAVFAPEITVTLEGIVTEEVELFRFIDAPPLAAAALRVAVQVAEPFGAIVLGVQASELSCALVAVCEDRLECARAA